MFNPKIPRQTAGEKCFLISRCYITIITEMKKWWNTAQCEDREPIYTGVVTALKKTTDTDIRVSPFQINYANVYLCNVLNYTNQSTSVFSVNRSIPMEGDNRRNLEYCRHCGDPDTIDVGIRWLVHAHCSERAALHYVFPTRCRLCLGERTAAPRSLTLLLHAALNSH
jgi:hypothetical protein